MLKNVFHNSKSINEDNVLYNSHPKKEIQQKKNVDVNKLLNRVRLEEKNQKKQKIIFCISGISLISFMGIFLAIIK